MTARFKKVFDRSENRKKAIDEMEPLSEEHENQVVPVTAVNDTVEEGLQVKPRTGVDLKRIEQEIDRVKVSKQTFV